MKEAAACCVLGLGLGVAVVFHLFLGLLLQTRLLFASHQEGIVVYFNCIGCLCPSSRAFADLPPKFSFMTVPNFDKFIGPFTCVYMLFESFVRMLHFSPFRAPAHLRNHHETSSSPASDFTSSSRSIFFRCRVSADWDRSQAATVGHDQVVRQHWRGLLACCSFRLQTWNQICNFKH